MNWEQNYDNLFFKKIKNNLPCTTYVKIHVIADNLVYKKGGVGVEVAHINNNNNNNNNNAFI